MYIHKYTYICINIYIYIYIDRDENIYHTVHMLVDMFITHAIIYVFKLLWWLGIDGNINSKVVPPGFRTGAPACGLETFQQRIQIFRHTYIYIYLYTYTFVRSTNLPSPNPLDGKYQTIKQCI